MVVEQAFGRLKGKWSLLTSTKCAQTSLATRCADVTACCVLHNIEIDISGIDIPDDPALVNPVFDGLTVRGEPDPPMPVGVVTDRAVTSGFVVQRAMVRTYG